MTRRWFGCIRSLTSGALLCVLFSLGAWVHAEESITVMSFGGSYAKACVKGYHIPFTESTGITVNLDDYNGGLAQIRAQAESGSVHWDVVDVESTEAIIGCDEGLFEPIELASLPPAADGTSPVQDYDDDVDLECGVPTIYWATVMAYNRELFEGEAPSTVEDFFDLEKFPGRRAMRRTPVANLEWALMADGVPLDKIYDELGTEEGLARAFEKLDSIRSSLIWWEAGAQPPQMLADGEVIVSTAYNGRIFNAQVLEQQPLEIIWNGQISAVAYLAVVTDSPNLENALRFVRFAARPESMAGVGRHIAYSPTRESGRALVTHHAETGVEMAPHLPAYPTNTKRRLINNDEFWANHLDELNERFSAWLAR